MPIIYMLIRREEKNKVDASPSALEFHSFSIATGESGNKSKWLELVDSAASLRSCDLECLGRLESLAEAESCMRRCIGELEAKEEAYMRALARADELCARAEAPATELERARAEADEMRKRLEACQAELERYVYDSFFFLSFFFVFAKRERSAPRTSSCVLFKSSKK